MLAKLRASSWGDAHPALSAGIYAQWGDIARAELQRLSDAAIAVFATGQKRQIEACLDARPSPWYTHALAPLLESLVTGHSSTHFFFSDANRGRHIEFRGDDVLEIPYYWEHRHLVRKPIHVPVPRDLLTWLKPLVDYERVAAQIIFARDSAHVDHALSQHPWVGGLTQAATGLAGLMLGTNVPA
jgi:alpha-galactosidase/6-phospho-beta-glucosidase family protein